MVAHQNATGAVLDRPFPRYRQRASPDDMVRMRKSSVCLSFAAGFVAAVAIGAGVLAAGSSFYSGVEAGEALSGGETTSTRTPGRNAFSHASANLSFLREFDFKIGNGVFKKLWVTAPASTKSSDGLGPLYNARSCQRCHLKDGRGHPPDETTDDARAVSFLLRLSVPPSTSEQVNLLASRRLPWIDEPTYGGQLQDFGTPGHRAEGKVRVTYDEVPVELADGTVVTLRRPDWQIADLGYGPMHPETMISPRIAPPMIGLGLLEAIDEADILSREDPNDIDGDGISGVASRVWSIEAAAPAVGRFGWKALHATMTEQATGAFAGDMGLSTSQRPGGHADCTASQADCRNAAHGDEKADGIEVRDSLLNLVVFYSRNLAVPARRDVDDPQVLAGKRIFHSAGCAACHTPSYVTGERADLPEQSGQKIWPYTDLLLHDMGEGLADNRPEGSANGREWRTPPLWGIGLTKAVNGHEFFLHDGRARGFLEAILWHGGEAEAARERVVALDKEDRDALLRFLGSL